MHEKMKSSFLVHCSRVGIPANASFLSTGTCGDESPGGPLDMAATAASSPAGVAFERKNFGIVTAAFLGLPAIQSQKYRLRTGTVRRIRRNSRPYYRSLAWFLCLITDTVCQSFSLARTERVAADRSKPTYCTVYTYIHARLHSICKRPKKCRLSVDYEKWSASRERKLCHRCSALASLMAFRTLAQDDCRRRSTSTANVRPLACRFRRVYRVTQTASVSVLYSTLTAATAYMLQCS